MCQEQATTGVGPFLINGIGRASTRLQRNDGAELQFTLSQRGEAHTRHLRGGPLTHAMKEAIARLLPPDIIERNKRGLGTPMGAWLKQGLAP